MTEMTFEMSRDTSRVESRVDLDSLAAVQSRASAMANGRVDQVAVDLENFDVIASRVYLAAVPISSRRRFQNRGLKTNWVCATRKTQLQLSRGVPRSLTQLRESGRRAQ